MSVFLAVYLFPTLFSLSLPPTSVSLLSYFSFPSFTHPWLPFLLSCFSLILTLHFQLLSFLPSLTVLLSLFLLFASAQSLNLLSPSFSLPSLCQFIPPSHLFDTHFPSSFFHNESVFLFSPLYFLTYCLVVFSLAQLCLSFAFLSPTSMSSFSSLSKIHYTL